MNVLLKMIAVIGMIPILILVGCNASKTSTNLTEKSAIEYGDPEDREEILKKSNMLFSNVYPLTGIGTFEEVNERIFAVMVNNHPKARPQSGLYKADIVYEILAEGLITRFLAIYQSELPEVVGPVRSAREYYILLSKDLGAIYVAYGGSPEAFSLLRDQNIMDYIGGILRKGYADDPFFYRADFRYAPHNVYITDDNLIKAAQTRHFSLTQNVEPFSFLTEEEMTALDRKSANEVHITYSNSYMESFKYDNNSNEYVRYVNGKQDKDRETEIPITVSNVLIIEAPHKVVDQEGRRDINFSNGGKGYLYQLGTVTEIEWKNVKGRFIPYIDGELAKFASGKTWVCVIPTYPGLDEMISF